MIEGIKMNNLTVDMGNDGYNVECELSVDGNEFCVKPCGVSFAVSPCGFGSTVREAVTNLKASLRNDRIKQSKGKK